jgi:hypothetical protein
MIRQNERARQVLLELYKTHRQSLSDFSYPWEREHDRWKELLVCLLIGAGVEAATARRLLHTMEAVGISSVTSLIEDEHGQAMIKRLCVNNGIDSAHATTVSKVLVSMASIAASRWDQHIQNFLRQYGEQMLHELTDICVKAGLNRRAAAKAATLWLQNALNMPLLHSDDPHIKKFCATRAISAAQLLKVADDIGLSAAVLDDILATESVTRARKGARRQKKSDGK